MLKQPSRVVLVTRDASLVSLSQPALQREPNDVSRMTDEEAEVVSILRRYSSVFPHVWPVRHTGSADSV